MGIKFVDQLLERRRKMHAMHLNSLPKAGYSAFMARISWPTRCMLVLSICALLGWAGLVPLNWSTLLILFLVGAVFPDSVFPPVENIDAVRNMPSMLHIEVRKNQRYLRVGMEEAPLSVVKKVAISKRDNEHAFIDFPYTSRITSPLRFPLVQIDSVRVWFSEHAPELELIE